MSLGLRDLVEIRGLTHLLLELLGQNGQLAPARVRSEKLVDNLLTDVRRASAWLAAFVVHQLDDVVTGTGS